MSSFGGGGGFGSGSPFGGNNTNTNSAFGGFGGASSTPGMPYTTFYLPFPVSSFQFPILSSPICPAHLTDLPPISSWWLWFYQYLDTGLRRLQYHWRWPFR